MRLRSKEQVDQWIKLQKIISSYYQSYSDRINHDTSTWGPPHTSPS